MSGLVKDIEHQKQPDDFNCIATCAAMVVGEPVETVLQEIQYGHNPMMYYPLLEEFFWKRGVKVDWIQGPHIYPSSLYMVDVPSLQSKATLHKIIIDWRNPGFPKIYDPLEGVEGKEFYESRMFEHGLLPFGNTMRLTTYRLGVGYDEIMDA